MGAWSRHPCRSHPENPQYPAFDSWPVASRSTPCVDEICQISNEFIRVDQGRHLPERTLSQQLAANCRRRGGSGCGGVSAMDGATEATWTYSRRPPQPDPPRQPPGSQLLLLLRLRLQPLRVQGAALQRAPYLNRPFCVKSQTSFRLAGSAAAVRFPPGSPATRVRPLRPPPLRRRSSRIPACASCRLHPILAARFTGTLRVSRSV